MAKVVMLHGGSQPSRLGEPRPDLIELLESLLEDARSGLLQSMVATGFHSDGNRMAIWAGSDNVYEMMGAIHWLSHEYARRCSAKD